MRETVREGDKGCYHNFLNVDGPRGEASKKLDSQRNRIIATQALKEARALADQGNYAEAKKILEAATKKISESVSVGEQFCQGLLSDLVNASDTMKSQYEYKSKGAHYLMSKYVDLGCC